MNEDVEVMIDDELMAQIEALAGMNPGTEEHASAVEDITKLYKLRIEKAKNDAELKQKGEQAEVDAKNRKIEHWIAAGSTAVQVALYVGIFTMGLHFEEHGALSSSFVRGFTNQIKLPKFGK